MDFKLLKLLSKEVEKSKFLYNSKSIDYKSAKGKQHYIDAYTMIAVSIMEEENKYFHLTRKIYFLILLQVKK